MGFKKLEDFLREDVEQLFGSHVVVIRFTFKYKDTGMEAQVVTPYTKSGLEILVFLKIIPSHLYNRLCLITI